ncbi:helix-turn-helix transcriptional regulator [Mucilaginibacter achroorhodeus]|uniref:Helix-turn-helix transcriptional regulator n=1 Tax=Mucilaginibacter achroorhodeus TaxID=2599294 RepID=A0A563U1A7_9SPHI|nr:MULTISPECIES: AraC family transcriptional regulator [Mucilaginibacter]QXV67525.1 helix-turn-helix transcriptional regulator [Mucilaginibacter sp. 21P]TWR25398.1 helix-turn-helix transcriptional regulator [Mucilaginibacter achroorhodeus]
MVNPTEIIPGIIFYAYLATKRKEKIGFFKHNTLVMQVSGQFCLETAYQKLAMQKGQMMLIGKNQLAEIQKGPLPNEPYQTVIITLQEDILRKIALEEQIEIDKKYIGERNLLIAPNEYLKGFFQSIMPYIESSSEMLTKDIGILKVREAVKLLLHAMPQLRSFLFDFSEPHKIDLESFMNTHFHFNMPIEKFAELTGRSLAGFKRDFSKTFGMAPRQWLQQRRLTEARHLIEHKQQKPSAIYLDLGFETLSHFSHAYKKHYGSAPTKVA